MKFTLFDRFKRENLNKPIILKDTSLSAIVRDEIMNAAGGIVDYVESIAPFVEEASIVDTGSKDGTREKLEELTLKHPNLRVFDRKFDDFASCRNYGLDQLRTKYALVLDGDERLCFHDFKQIKKIMRKEPAKGYRFTFSWIYPNSLDDTKGGGHNPRLFEVSKKIRYENSLKNSMEFLRFKGSFMHITYPLINTGVEIKHFCSNRDSRRKKSLLWYEAIVDKGKAKNVAPSDIDESKLWNEYNPRREFYRE